MGHPITIEDITIVAQNYTNDKSTQVLDYCVDKNFNERLGLLSSHGRLTIKIQRSNANESESVSFFLKFISYNVQVQVDLLTENGMFLKESNFFVHIIPELFENCKSEQWYPKCYLAKRDAIILHDLKAQKYNVIDNFDNVLLLKSALVSLAQFHGASILMEDRLNRNSENYITLSEYYSDKLEEMAFSHKVGVLHDAMFTSFDVSCALAKRLGYDPNELKKKSCRLFEMIKQSKTHRNVICHGDLWCHNMMFNDNYKCILVDFQFIRYAPLVTDLLQLLHLNTSRSFRKDHEKELVEYYHSALKKFVEDNDKMDSVKVPTLEKVVAGMDDLRLVGLVTVCFYFPVILIDPKIAAENCQDAESYRKFILGSKIELLLDYMKTNKRYKCRLEEAVIELAEHIDSSSSCTQ